MSVAGNCEICGTGGVDHTCSRCAQLVCEKHFDEETGLCVECLSEVGGGSDQERQPQDMPDGVDTYRF
ncbi:hypothetical protein BV210_13655 [Halorientalis sp. IM1011]|uniref:hypothetical protein n=1 Tax=Halorientalis sp. IM1011 TaxID=1932360 RepID=UPI00097CC2D2|nr:hypothetical protein [Halorientalis sp. IM1011]AQL43683.1 hypothetical protein BV210_13655 [Halorientalis sp. IM1011]